MRSSLRSLSTNSSRTRSVSMGSDSSWPATSLHIGINTFSNVWAYHRFVVEEQHNFKSSPADQTGLFSNMLTRRRSWWPYGKQSTVPLHFQPGVTWWPGGSILGAKFPPLKCMAIVSPRISETVRPIEPKGANSNRPPNWVTTNVLVDEIHLTRFG